MLIILMLIKLVKWQLKNFPNHNEYRIRNKEAGNPGDAAREKQYVKDNSPATLAARLHRGKFGAKYAELWSDKGLRKIGFKLKWVGKGIHEKAINTENKKFIIECKKRYFRPVEVDFLKGNAQKAKKLLKWSPKTSIDDLIDEMIKKEL